MKSKCSSFIMHVNNLGIWQAIVYNIFKILLNTFKFKYSVKLFSKYSNFPLICRPNSSDFSSFYQVFALREYSCLDFVINPILIIDCGANVGYSSAYFLSKYPNAQLIAIEPDTENYYILEKNLSRFNGRVKTLNTAVWSHDTNLTFVESSLGPKKEWARQLRETQSGEMPHLQATNIGSLLSNSGFPLISILKIDVEGAEKVIFSRNIESWINNVDNIVIELHGNQSKSIFSQAVLPAGFSCSQHGELTLGKKS